MAVCGIKCSDSTKDAIKMLGIFFKKTIIGIEKVLRMWRQRNLTLESKIIIFKILSLTKLFANFLKISATIYKMDV